MNYKSCLYFYDLKCLFFKKTERILQISTKKEDLYQMTQMVNIQKAKKIKKMSMHDLKVNDPIRLRNKSMKHIITV